MRSSFEPLGSGAAAHAGDSTIVAEALSKRYPRRRVTLFPPVVSIFDRDWFSRRRSSAEDGPPARSEGPARGPGDDLDDYDVDDEDLDEDDDDLTEEVESQWASAADPARPGEMFWALRDISFRVAPGGALGVLGAPGSGKSTLLGILGGQVVPTEGRVLVRDRVSPLPEALRRALSTASKGARGFDIVHASRLLGFESHLVKQHREEIEELASPLLSAHGEPLPAAMTRLAIATAAVVPASVVLLDEYRGLDEDFVERIVEHVRDRLRKGGSLVLASRSPELVRQLCDEAIVLEDGSIVERGAVKGVVRGYEAENVGPKAGGDSATLAPSRHLSWGRKLVVPRVVPAFNGSAALISATLRTSSDRMKRIDAADEVYVEIRLETALPDIEARCGVGFAPRDGEGIGVRLELPEPLRFPRPGTYVLAGRAQPGALPSGTYEVGADAVVVNPAERGATVIARDIGRVRVVGDEFDGSELAEPPVPHWDGRLAWRAAAEWTVE